MENKGLGKKCKKFGMQGKQMFGSPRIAEG